LSPESNETLLSRFVVPLAAIVEVGTGLTILIVPRLFAFLLLGADVDQVGAVVARICGLALLSFGLACWPEKQVSVGLRGVAPVRGLLTYNALLTIYLAYLRIPGGYRGILLLPAIILHAVLTILLINHYVRLKTRKP
jgi:hypothetical protein